MPRGRPPGDSPPPGRSKRGGPPNEDRLRALGEKMGSGDPSGSTDPAAAAAVANQLRLEALGGQIDRAERFRPRHRRRWTTRRKLFTAIGGVMALIVLVGAGGYGYLQYRYGQLDKIHVSADRAEISGQPFNILVIGSDSRVGESSSAFGSSSVVTGQRSDVVMIWHVDPGTRQVSIISIPRDTLVSMDADQNNLGQFNRINSAYNEGANLSVKTIEENFGIPVNHVVQIDFSGFQGAVDALGGVWMNFPYPAKDVWSGLDITNPGCQRLNGAQALAVARSRHYEYYANGYWQYDGTSDFGRIQRQDVFIKALITAAKSKVNPLTVNSFLGSIHEGIQIDDGFGFNELIGLALTYHSFDPTSLGGLTLPTVAANGFGDLGDVLTVDQPAAQQMLVSIFGSSLVTPTN